jgi:hypothetical protein
MTLNFLLMKVAECLFVCQKKIGKVVQRDGVYGKANQGVRVRR